MRVRYCCTSSCEVTRPAFSAACMSAMEASTTLKGFGWSLAVAVRATESRATVSILFIAARILDDRPIRRLSCRLFLRRLCVQPQKSLPSLGRIDALAHRFFHLAEALEVAMLELHA